MMTMTESLLIFDTGTLPVKARDYKWEGHGLKINCGVFFVARTSGSERIAEKRDESEDFRSKLF